MTEFLFGFVAGVLVTVAVPKVYSYGAQIVAWIKSNTNSTTE